MDLEQQIKDLERKLALKKAYLSIEIKLPKGTSEEIKEEIESNVRSFCANQAQDVRQDHTTVSQNNTFTDEEVTVLKTVVAAAIEKMGGAKPADKAVVKAKVENKPLMAVLLTTESLTPDRRKLVTSNTRVQIVSLNDKEACFMHERNRFVVPKEDLEFEIEEGDSK